MKIAWSKPAVTDLNNIREYISKDSQRYASIFTAKLISAVDRLAEFPQSGRIVPEMNRHDIREVIYQHYRIIYKIESDQLIIMTVVHGGRDLSRWKE